jgi:aminoglycoside phosphotransferase family enzyme
MRSSGSIDIGKEPATRQQFHPIDADDLALDRKLEFLSQPNGYPHPVAGVTCRETHMSWVFLAGDRAYKLKKPVRFPYLDFSTIERREAACRAELKLNRRLAHDIYLDVEPLTVTPRGLSIGGNGTIADWLVIMRRLDEYGTLERAILDDRVEPRRLDRLIATLVGFYRHADRALMSPTVHLREWHQSLLYNKRILLDQRLGLPSGLVRQIDYVQRRFLSCRSKMLVQRVRDRNIVDGHGDLRPEHIWLGETINIIDCLEFNPRLRAVDPFDEIAFLTLECERLGATWAGDYLKRHLTRGLHDHLSEELFLFYRCHRATLRARLAIAHLLEQNPRTPEKWPRLAQTYLRFAAATAVKIERILNSQEGRRKPRHCEAA